MTATDTYLLLRAFCDELARCGMRHACTSPGSRCAPLVFSLVRERRISCFSHLDERCAGFFALGAAKASGLPVAVACTSGTAAANLAPAVIEACQARVPLLVLTADRPDPDRRRRRHVRSRRRRGARGVRDPGPDPAARRPALRGQARPCRDRALRPAAARPRIRSGPAASIRAPHRGPADLEAPA